MEFDISREWLETNGIGGFASSTIIGCNTRRYHALLCAAVEPPLGRMVLVNKADETITLKNPAGDRHFDLGCNQYPGAVHPTGYRFLQEFSTSPLPRWTYILPASITGASDDLILEKELWMPHGQNSTVMRYTLVSGADVVLSLHPFVTGRDYHHVQRYNTTFNTTCTRGADDDGRRIAMQPYENCPPLVFAHDGDFYEAGAWYYCFEYSIEQERGLEFEEDAYCPGAFVWHLTAGGTALFIVSTTPRQAGAGQEEYSLRQAWRDSQIARREELAARFHNLPDLEPLAPTNDLTKRKIFLSEDRRQYAMRLARAADQFIVRRKDNLHTVIAGYPWFSDWGRDTMIALPGLCLTTGRFYEAASILLSFAKAASQGMIPNRFPDAGETPDYNTVDATLWFFHAAAQYLERSGDWKTVSALYPTLRECIEWHIKGTRYGIRADPNDGLLSGGDATTQLTWMDAKVGDWVVTPRAGKPVEIQALWFNALCTMANFAAHMSDAATNKLCAEWSGKIKANFQAVFWNEECGCLYDCIDGEHKDGAVRPNQIFAVSLSHRLLTSEQEKRVVETVERDLLTPYGLRSLSPHDAGYRGICTGSQWERDGAYHQGTVWSWLMGPFLTAYLHVNTHSAEAGEQARTWLSPLLAHLDEACVNNISEIFDGDAPHHPRGCFAQAWSVAEVLRVLAEEL
ncbi:MAG TPA: amylo-alpha-1,6-glucosidase [Abditibacteriaceae bacterium]|nr:amylo-alpha-1,6-glucosidase [Abditibacteriaceae bacterium]